VTGIGADIDTGVLLEVPKSQQLEEDDPAYEDDNEDQFTDLSGVPDGEVVTLSTAHLDEED
jgi:hypothetical protein